MLIVWVILVVILFLMGMATTVLNAISLIGSIIVNTAIGVFLVSSVLAAMYSIGSIRSRYLGLMCRVWPRSGHLGMRRMIRWHRRFRRTRDRAVASVTDVPAWRRAVVVCSALLSIGVLANVNLVRNALKPNAPKRVVSAESQPDKREPAERHQEPEGGPGFAFPKNMSQANEYEARRRELLAKIGREFLRQASTRMSPSCASAILNEESVIRVVSLFFAAFGLAPVAAEDFRVHEAELNGVACRLDPTWSVRVSADRVSVRARGQSEKDPGLEASIFVRKRPGEPVEVRLDGVSIGALSLPASLLDRIDPRAGGILWHFAKSKIAPVQGFTDFVAHMEQSFDRLEAKTGQLHVRVWHRPVSGVTSVHYFRETVEAGARHGQMTKRTAGGRQGDLVYVIERERESAYAFFPTQKAFGWVPVSALLEVSERAQ